MLKASSFGLSIKSMYFELLTAGKQKRNEYSPEKLKYLLAGENGMPSHRSKVYFCPVS